MPDRDEWTDEDNTFIRVHWPQGQQEELLRRFPLSTWTSIRHQANTMGVYRSKGLKSGRQKVNPYHITMTYADLETAMHFAEMEEIQDDQALLFYGSVEEATQYDEEEGFAYMRVILNEFAETTPRGKISAYWPWSVEVVGFSGLTQDEETSSRLSEHGWNATRTDDVAGSGHWLIPTLAVRSR